MTTLGAVFLPQLPPERLHAVAGAAEQAGLEEPGYDPAQDIGIAGDAPAVADAVGRWADAGADTVVLQPTADDPDPEGFVRFVAREVRPLVR